LRTVSLSSSETSGDEATVVPSRTGPAKRDGAARQVAEAPAGYAWWRRPVVLLALVAAVHAVLPILILGRHWFIGIDESVYLSQINAHVPPGGFSAPRARGSTFVAAPITAFTDAVAPMRYWTTVLSGLGLFLAFRTWLRLRPGYLVPVAAAMFASIWVVTYYGFQVMPNEWVAFATVGGCGSLLSFLLDGKRWSLVGATLALGVAALFRPSDAVFALIALGVVCVLARATWTRRAVAFGTLAIGAAAGATDWVIEAYTTYGGLRQRVHVAEAEQGGSGLHWAGSAQAHVLAGPVLCRNSCAVRAGPAVLDLVGRRRAADHRRGRATATHPVADLHRRAACTRSCRGSAVPVHGALRRAAFPATRLRRPGAPVRGGRCCAGPPCAVN
jgi:hypothetical protein